MPVGGGRAIGKNLTIFTVVGLVDLITLASSGVRIVVQEPLLLIVLHFAASAVGAGA